MLTDGFSLQAHAESKLREATICTWILVSWESYYHLPISSNTSIIPACSTYKYKFKQLVIELAKDEIWSWKEEIIAKPDQ